MFSSSAMALFLPRMSSTVFNLTGLFFPPLISSIRSTALSSTGQITIGLTLIDSAWGWDGIFISAVLVLTNALT